MVHGQSDVPMIFSKKIFLRPISIFNYGKMSRDFTFIEDIVIATFYALFKKLLKTIMKKPIKI